MFKSLVNQMHNKSKYIRVGHIPCLFCTIENRQFHRIFLRVLLVYVINSKGVVFLMLNLVEQKIIMTSLY